MRLASLPIGATVYTAGRTQIAVEIILGYESRRSASYSRRARLKMEVEGRRGDKEGIDGQVMSAPACCADTIEKDIVVPDQAGDRSEARVNHWDRGAPIVNIVEHSDIVRLIYTNFTAVGMSRERGGLCRGKIILVGRVIENIHVLTSANSDSLATVVVNNVVVDLNSSIIARGLVAIYKNPLTVRNSARIGLIFVTDIILIVVNEVVVHENLGSRARIAVSTLDCNAVRAIWRPKGVVVDDIPVDGDVIPGKCYSLSRTIRDSVVPYYDVMNTAATADTVSVCCIVLVWCRLCLTDRNAFGVTEDREAVDNDIGGTPGRIPDLDAIPGGAVL